MLGLPTDHLRISKRTSMEVAPLSFAQERLWTLNQLEPDSPAYNQPKAIRIRGHLDREPLVKALESLVLRHEILRSVFTWRGERPVQIVRAESQVDLPVVDLSAIPELARLAEFRKQALVISRQPFILDRDMMLRPVLFRLSDDDHILLVVNHHIVSDNRSNTILFDEVIKLYRAMRSGTSIQLAKLPVQYADYALWQREWVEKGGVKQDLDYWVRQMKGCIQFVDLPIMRRRSGTVLYDGARREIDLGSDVAAAVRAFSIQARVTVFMTLLATFFVLLHKYSGQDDIPVGVPIAGRNRVELERLIGCFLNILVIRADLAGKPSFIEFVLRLRQRVIEAFAHQNAPFETLVAVLDPERRIDRSPLFNTLFNFQKQTHDSDIEEFDIARCDVNNQTAKYDLALSVIERRQSFTAVIEYRSSICEEAFIGQILGQYKQLLSVVLQKAETVIADTPLMTEEERHRVLTYGNQSAAGNPTNHCVHELFERQVELGPDRVAVICEEMRVTYKELNERANHVSIHLQALGVGSDTLVGVCMDRSIELVVGLLGVLKSGGAYVPIDPTLPEERIRLMLQDSGANIVLTQEPFSKRLMEAGYQALIVEAIANECDTGVMRPKQISREKDLAYVIYTSGSTGIPKGVEIEHRSLVNCLRSFEQILGMTKADVVLAITTVSFDIAGLEMFLPLIVGARLVVAGSDVLADPILLAKVIDDSDASVMQATPATWKMLVDSGWKGRKSLKCLCGGEALHTDLAKTLSQRSKDVWNLYGPTETTIWSLAWKLTTEFVEVSIGRPIDRTSVFVLDHNQCPVPIGAIGELYISGVGLARGYHDRSDLTARHFRANPFVDLQANVCVRDADSPTDYNRMYKTGDLVYYSTSGDLYFVGRSDNQVKLRGFRIELGEIEKVLSSTPNIADAIVLLQEDQERGKYLVAYVIADSPVELSVAELQAALKQRLPSYMIPADFMQCKAFPLTSNGKVDRKALAELRVESVSATAIHRKQPLTDLEQQVAKEFANVLGREAIDADKDFFDLGGHSLLAVALVNRLGRSFKIDLALRLFMELPSVAGVAAKVRELVDRRQGELINKID